ncbi:MAG: hypothetical protein OXI24_05425, partial [Candidatus Poribacteria bacterium]|nr:hypothetical protein [Candidatus Poribacteria bacterium]
MYTEEQQIDRLSELHKLLIDLRDYVKWPEGLQGSHLDSTMRTMSRLSEAIIREAAEGRFSIAMTLSLNMS